MFAEQEKNEECMCGGDILVIRSMGRLARNIRAFRA
jgi:hypothetical protein